MSTPRKLLEPSRELFQRFRFLEDLNGKDARELQPTHFLAQFPGKGAELFQAFAKILFPLLKGRARSQLAPWRQPHDLRAFSRIRRMQCRAGSGALTCRGQPADRDTDDRRTWSNEVAPCWVHCGNLQELLSGL